MDIVEHRGLRGTSWTSWGSGNIVDFGEHRGTSGNIVEHPGTSWNTNKTAINHQQNTNKPQQNTNNNKTAIKHQQNHNKTPQHITHPNKTPIKHNKTPIKPQQTPTKHQ